MLAGQNIAQVVRWGHTHSDKIYPAKHMDSYDKTA